MSKKKQIAYDYLKEEIKNSPMLFHYPEADGDATIVAFPSGNTYGVGYCIPFATLEQLLEDPENYGQILAMFSAEGAPISKAELSDFAKTFRSHALSCNTEYKKEMLQRADELEAEIAALGMKKNLRI